MIDPIERGKALKEARLKRRMSLQAACAHFVISDSTWENWEAGVILNPHEYLWYNLVESWPELKPYFEAL